MDVTKELWNRLGDEKTYPGWLIESIGSYMGPLLHEYAVDVVSNSISVVNTLQEFLQCCGSPMCQRVIQEALAITTDYIENSAERDEIKDIMGTNNTVKENPTAICSDVELFCMLYQKGIVTDDTMQTLRTSQFHGLVSTFSDLMGEERKGRAYGPTKTPPIPLQDWLDGWEYLEARNRELCNGDLSTISNGNDKELLRCLKFHTEKLPLAISDGTYDDMCVNAVICYTFMVLAAGAIQRSKEANWNKKVALKETDEVLRMLQDFIEKYEGNAYMVLGAMLMMVIYQRLLVPFSVKLSDKYAIAFSKTFDKNNYKIPNYTDFPLEVRRLISKLESFYDVRLTEDDAIVFHIPIPFPFTWWQFAKTSPRNILLWDELKDEELGKNLCGKVPKNELPQTITEAMDSLVSGFQVESGVFENLGVVDFTALELHQGISDQLNQMLQQVVQEDLSAIWETIATNLVVAEDVKEMIHSVSKPELSKNDCLLLEQDLYKMDYQNKKYIGIVEATKNDASIQNYAKSHKEQLLAAFREKYKNT